MPQAASDGTGPERLGKNVGYGKVGVIGAIEPKDNVVSSVIGYIEAHTTFRSFVGRAVDEKVSLLATDENPAYIDLGLSHETVRHSTANTRAATCMPTTSNRSGACSSAAWSVPTARSRRITCRSI